MSGHSGQQDAGTQRNIVVEQARGKKVERPNVEHAPERGDEERAYKFFKSGADRQQRRVKREKLWHRARRIGVVDKPADKLEIARQPVGRLLAQRHIAILA